MARRVDDHRHRDLEEMIGRVQRSVSTGAVTTVIAGSAPSLPISAKGDLVTHDGTQAARLPVVSSTATVLRPVTTGSFGIGWTPAAVLATTGTSTGSVYALQKNSSVLWGLQEAVTVSTTGAAIGNLYVLQLTVDGWQVTQLTTSLIDGL